MNPHPVPQVMPATEDSVYERLQSMYWDAATREVCNMIKFYNEMVDFDVDIDEVIDAVDSNVFRNMFKVWMGGQSGAPEDSNYSYDRLLAEALSSGDDRHKIDKPRRLARMLLQSSALLDLDIVYEPALSPFPSYRRGPPNVEKVRVEHADSGDRHCGTALRGITCSRCNLLIRSLTYYECREGCLDEKSTKLRSATIKPNGRVNVKAADTPLKSSARRLCSWCLGVDEVVNGCRPGHFRRMDYKPTDCKGTKTFQDIISDREDNEYRKATYKSTFEWLSEIPFEFAQQYNNTMVQMEERLSPLRKLAPKMTGQLFSIGFQGSSPLIRGMQMVKDAIFPAGNFHLSMMFGPLIFESGIPRTMRGVLISPRQLPTLFMSVDAAHALLPDVDRDLSGIVADCTVFYQEKKSKHRGFYREFRKISPKSKVACLKRVYGGAFSGYPETSSTNEVAVLDCLVREAAKCKFNWCRKITAQEKQLHRSAGEVIKCVRQLLGGDVDKYLRRIAGLLMDRSTKMSWSMWSNNCQRLVDRLLGGKDFEYSFPRPLRNHVSSEQKTTSVTHSLSKPRYLLSFGNHIENLGFRLGQPDSAIEVFLKSKNVDYDIMEYFSSNSKSHAELFALAASTKSVKITIDFFYEYFCEKLANTLRNSSVSKATPKLSDSTTQLTLLNCIEDAQKRANLINNGIWELPRDTLSLLQFHLIVPGHKCFDTTDRHLSEENWMKNRMLVLQLLDGFASRAGGLGVALNSMFASEPDMISNIIIPKAFIYGNARYTDVIKAKKASWRGKVLFLYSLKRRDGFSRRAFNGVILP